MEDYLKRKVICRTIDGGQEEREVGELSFRPSVYGVIIKDGAVLLVPFKDGYDFPGGGVHEGELIADALVREVKEESGIEAKQGGLIHLQEDFFVHPRSGKAFHTILFYYLCEQVGGALSSDGLTEFEKTMAGERTPEWVPVQKALEVKFYNPIDSPALIRKAAGI